MTESILWPLALAILGSIIGSFMATIAVRWPQHRSVLRGRSACDGCGRPLRATELVPLLSAAILHGRCRSCGAPIDPTHWRIEAGAALIGAISGLVAPGAAGLAGAVFGWLLLTLAVIDAAELWLPDELTAALALSGVAAGLYGLPPAPVDRLVGGSAGFAMLWLIAFGYRRVRGHDGMGGGDPKLYGAIGLWIGWRMLPAVLLIAALVGLGYALFERFRGRAVTNDTALPFGTFLAIAAYPAWLVMVMTQR